MIDVKFHRVTLLGIDTWLAVAWIDRNTRNFEASGRTKEEAYKNLYEFMKTRVKIWQYKVELEKETLTNIEKWIENHPSESKDE